MNKYAKQLNIIANELERLLNQKGNNSDFIYQQILERNVERGQLLLAINYFQAKNKPKYIYQMMNNGILGNSENDIFKYAFKAIINMKSVVDMYSLVVYGMLNNQQVEECSKFFDSRQLVKLNSIIKQKNFGYTLQYGQGIPVDSVSENARKKIDASIHQYFIDNRNRKNYENDRAKGTPSYFFEDVDTPLKQHFKILKENGITPIQEDGTPWQGMLLGKSGQAVFRLADKVTLCPINNAMLVFDWYTTSEVGQFTVQITSYLS